MITRTAQPKLLEMASKYPVVAVLGPRQSGKTTLVKHCFPNFNYVSLETPDNREYASTDPRGFLDTYQPPVILDEIQKVPEMFSYLQETVDSTNKSGQYIITGSQNFVLNEKISQTLAGRVYLLTLPTFTHPELAVGKMSKNWQEYTFKGTYPRVWDKRLAPADWYPSYIQTYLERDVRDIKNVSNIRDFQIFLKLCAARVGQALVLSSISNELGVSHNTIKSWLSILESSYIIFLLKPYFKNLNKRLVKSPKLYFLDPGLGTHLLNITHPNQVETHPLRGNLFENLVISEIIKLAINKGVSDLGYFLRDKTGNEVDYVSEQSDRFTMIEAKASQTTIPDHFKGIKYWKTINPRHPNRNFIIYAGHQEKVIQGTHILPWTKLAKVMA